MTSQVHSYPELPDLITVLLQVFPGSGFLRFLQAWQNVFYSLLAVAILAFFSYRAARRPSLIPGRLQSLAEVLVEGVDDFICGILGKEGRKYTPFIGTLFIYILLMNILGLIPFLKSATASWSTTLALGLCVFFYVQYAGVRRMGFFGYLDHMAGRPRKAMAFSIVLPLLLFAIHVITELIRPISLSLRLRSNIWGDDLLLAVLAGFGLRGVPLLVINTLSGLLVAVVQAVVFCLLSTIYFALVLTTHQEE
jgi:F-type H+-transporting ATPase subunit a